MLNLKRGGKVSFRESEQPRRGEAGRTLRVKRGGEGDGIHVGWLRLLYIPEKDQFSGYVGGGRQGFLVVPSSQEEFPSTKLGRAIQRRGDLPIFGLSN